ATTAGCAVVITDAGEPDALLKVLAGRRLGTLFAPQGGRAASRKRWMTAGVGSAGAVTLDAGACRALLEEGRSLLPVGVAEVRGTFEAGELVPRVAPKGPPIGRGLY